MQVSRAAHTHAHTSGVITPSLPIQFVFCGVHQVRVCAHTYCSVDFLHDFFFASLRSSPWARLPVSVACFAALCPLWRQVPEHAWPRCK
uniref:Uncharacterized protein n=1 Tax=Rhipicephalus appendiculatus TaxID=34631 RepID=A0A131YHH9_RHIAP